MSPGRSDSMPAGSIAANTHDAVPAPSSSSRSDRNKLPTDHSAPVTMQPSGPVPAAATVASGSGPHDDGAKPAAPKCISIPSNAAEALTAWNVVLEQLETLKKFSLSGPFSHARVMKWTHEVIELGFPVEVHAMGEMAADADKLAEMRAIVRELGPELKTIKLAVRLLDERESASAGARSMLETTRDRSSAERTKRESEAREHPITKHVLQTFGAQIKEIKTDV